MRGLRGMNVALWASLVMLAVWLVLQERPSHSVSSALPPRPLGAGTTANSAAARTAPNPFAIPWDDYASPSGDVRIISAAQDHRTFPPKQQLASSIRAATFPSIASDPRYRVIQFHMALNNKFVDVANQKTDAFDRVELNWHEEAGPRLLPAHQCLHNLPRGTGWRMAHGAPKFLEIIVRCAFLIENELMEVLQDHSTSRASLAVYMAKERVDFPLSEVFHLASPARLLPHHEQPPTFRTAPWIKHQERLSHSVVRPAAGSATAALRVGVACTKKYTWNDDDELWLMWMLDVVGVTHVVLDISTRDLELSKVEKGIAKHPGLAERVTLVDVDIPFETPPITYCYLIESVARDVFMRWQADFDYIFLIDADEFVQLFDTEPPFARLDVRTFIERNQERIRREGVAYFRRPTILRSEANHASDPLLGEFLQTLPLLNGQELFSIIEPEAREPKGDKKMSVGKSLFWPPRSVYSFLHYNPDTPPVYYNVSQAHMLHVRQEVQAESIRQYVKRMAPWRS